MAKQIIKVGIENFSDRNKERVNIPKYDGFGSRFY